MDRASRTLAHLLITFALANIAAGITALRVLDLVSHAQFLTLSIGVAVAANRARTLGLCALGLFLTGPLFLVACSLGAGLAVGLVLREGFGVRNGQPVPDALAGQHARAAHGDAGFDRQLGDPFGVARAQHPPPGRPAHHGTDDRVAADRGGRAPY